MKKFYILFLTAIVIFTSQTLIAQNMVTHQIIVCSGGDFSNPDDFVTIAAYSPNSGQTIVFDTIYTQSVQDVIIDNGFAFVAAQDSIVKYDLNTYERLATVGASGVHKLAVRNGTLIATFWYPETSGYVKTFLSSNLNPDCTFNEVSGESDGIFIFPGSLRAVVAVPGGWENTLGILAWFDMADNIFYGQNNMNGHGSGVSYFASYDTGIPNFVAITKTPWGDSTFSTYGFDAIGNNTGSYSYEAVMQGYTGQNNTTLYARINDGIGQLDLANHILEDQLIIEPTSLTIASSVYDSVNSYFYVATTDYFSIGAGYIYNINGEIIGSFGAGISPEAIAIDYRENTGIIDMNSEDGIKIFPNPSSDVMTIKVSDKMFSDNFRVIDICGHEIMSGRIRLINSEANIDISVLQSGLYFLILSDGRTLITRTFIKK